ncbi:ATP-dependent Clp protease proteolytic subunit 1 [bioreactor metagenome]|uniref:ATP-dependent Clp protease proteolytic subunit 1 n=1 Tax=bioreactor metagenome TaxID=1076179 RepID=A0A644VUI8_9ZZZZ
MELQELILPIGTGCTMELADPGLLNYYEQLDRRTIWVDSEIDITLLELTKKILAWNTEDRLVPVEDRIPIRVCIFSPGGNLAETMHACSVIQMSRTPIYTYNMGMSMSGGFMLLIAGLKGHRYALPYSRSLCHSGSGGVSGDFQRAKDAMDDYKAQISDMQNFILEHTDISKAQLTKKKDCDWYMGAEDMVKYGVVDHIITDIGEIIG